MPERQEFKKVAVKEEYVEKVPRAKFIKIIDMFNELTSYCDEENKVIKKKVLSLYDNDEDIEELEDPCKDDSSIVSQLNSIVNWLYNHHSELVDIRERLEEIV